MGVDELNQHSVAQINLTPTNNGKGCASRPGCFSSPAVRFIQEYSHQKENFSAPSLQTARKRGTNAPLTINYSAAQLAGVCA
jgi:hypothetical protein